MTAMAMGCDPRLIVFDEPTTALDVTTQIEVLSTIKEAVRARGVAAIYITHDLAVVAQLADRIMVLRYGNLVEEGNARDLLENPQQEYTRRLLAVRSLREEKGASEKDDTVLEVSGVSARYPGVEEVVLSDISVKVQKGQNGCGSRRVRKRQEHPRQGDHRTAAALCRRRSFSR